MGMMRRVHIAAIGGAVMAFLLVVAVAQRFGSSGGEAISIGALGDRSLSILSCDANGLWLWAWEKPNDKSGQLLSRSAIASLKSAIIEVSVDGGIQEADIGRGLISGFSGAKDGSMWALLREGHGLPSERSRVLVSTDRGRTWVNVEAPGDGIGLAFETRKKGYVWSAAKVYRTEDGGRTWRSVELYPLRLRRGRSGVPVLEGNGELWVPLNKEWTNEPSPPEPPAASLLVIKPDLSITELATWSSDSIDGVAPDGSGGALALVAPLTRGGYRVERITPRSSSARPIELRAQSSMGVADFQSVASMILILEVTFDPKGHVFSNPRQSVVVSIDSGETWSTRNASNEAVTAVCLTEAGYWTLSERHRRLVFTHVPRR